VPNRLTRNDFKRFAKQKGLASPSRVMAGGLRAVYRHPDQVRLVRGYDVNGTREPGSASNEDVPSRSPEAGQSAEADADSADG
jgi:hypothetical protein